MTQPTHMAESSAPSYVLDAARSRFQVRATAVGLLSAFGHSPTIAIRSFTGEAEFRTEAPQESSLRLDIDAASLAVTGDVNEKDRQEIERTMREEVLETSRYPRVRFVSSSVQASQITEGMYRMKILGKLSLHGEERDLEIPCNATVGNDSLRVNGEFSIRQSDYHIKPVTAAGGTIKLKDDLKFTFDIAGQRKKV